MDHSPLAYELVTLRAENAALKEQVVRLQTTPASLREDLRCVISDICAQVRERDETIAQQAAVIEQLREALDCLGNNLGEYALAMQTQQQADVLSNYAEAAFQARTLQPSPEILAVHDKQIAEACAVLATNWGNARLDDNGGRALRNCAEAIRSGEWRKHL